MAQHYSNPTRARDPHALADARAGFEDEDEYHGDADEHEGGQCATCETPARHRTCDGCGRHGWVIDCGCRAQPRPLAADGPRILCDTCADGEGD